MSWLESPDWLLELQTRFGGMLRTPLERSSGTLRAETSAYESALVAAVRPTATLSSAERLAIYQRQHWFRLLTVLQSLYPLTARLLGYWRFNEYAVRHLLERPPRGSDIETVGDGLDETLSRQLPPHGTVQASSRRRVGVAALLEAARVDAAFHRVTRAVSQPPFSLAAQDPARLGSSCFVLSSSVALLQERWPLCELRLSLVQQQSGGVLQLGERLRSPRHWLLAWRQGRLGLLQLEPHEARLLALLQEHSLEHALGLLESNVPELERAQLPERARAWLARSVRLGVWSSLGTPRGCSCGVA